MIVACSGDIFSGNPVVDNYPEKGYPMIGLMNEVGFDISVLGNHEFDYGETILKDRMEQAQFSWVCANVDMGNTGIPEPLEYKTIKVGDLTIAFLGLVETYGNPDATLPASRSVIGSRGQDWQAVGVKQLPRTISSTGATESGPQEEKAGSIIKILSGLLFLVRL